MERENAALSKIWSIKQEWDREWDEWKEIAFQELKSDEEILAQMDERAVEIKMKLDNLEAAEKKWKVTEYINDKIRVFRDTIPLIEDLRHESMRDRHWKELRIEVKEDFDEEVKWKSRWISRRRRKRSWMQRRGEGTRKMHRQLSAAVAFHDRDGHGL